MKFDVIVVNPPYMGRLYLKFLEWCFELLNDTGKIIFITPASWLILLRDGKTREIYNKVKKKLFPYIKTVDIIKNVFSGIGLYTPLSITYIDKSVADDEIKFKFFNEEMIVNDVNDINMIGKYAIIKSIEQKIKNKVEYSIKDFINKNSQKFFINISFLVGNGWVEEKFYDGKIRKFSNRFNIINKTTNKITTERMIARPQAGKTIGNAKNYISFGTHSEANNFLKYITVSKLTKFLVIAYNIDQHIESVYHLIPWMDFNKEWTDDKINDFFNFSKQEIDLINVVIDRNCINENTEAS